MGGGFLSALRIATRGVVRRPGFTLVAVLTLALGIGANSAIFSILYGALWRPLSYPDADRLVWLADAHESFPRGRAGMSVLNYLDIRQASSQIQSTSAFLNTGVSVRSGDRPERVRGLWVNASFLSTLGLSPALGRDFREEDDRAGAESTVILTHGYWQDAFGGEEEILGRVVSIDRSPHTVIGIAPPDFTFPNNPRVLMPFRWDAAANNRLGRGIHGVARLAPGATLAAATEELQSIMGRLVQAHPEANEGWRLRVFTSREWIVGDDDRPLYLVGGAALLVLLIAVVNMTNLLLVRAEGRRDEFAVRMAMGAPRIRLLPEFLGEALLLAVLGGAVGLLAVYGTSDLVLATFRDSIPRPDEVAFGPVTAIFAVGLSLLVAVGAGMISWLVVDPGVRPEAVRPGARGEASATSRFQRALIVGQMAVAVLVVVLSGLLTRSFSNVMSVDLGISDPQEILVFSVSLPGESYPTGEDRVAFYQALESELDGIPGAGAVGFTTVMPLQGGATATRVWPVGDPERFSENVDFRRVSPDLFDALGVELVGGRMIRWDDAPDGAPPAVVVNQTVARALFDDEREPMGAVLQYAPGEEYRVRVVGMVTDFRDRRPQNPFPPGLYLPISPSAAPSSVVGVVKTARDPMSLAPLVREAVRSLDRDLPVSGLQRLSDVQLRLAGSHYSSMVLVGVFALLALGLGGVGVYGVMGYTVARRQREIGIRMAIGSNRIGVFKKICFQGLGLGAVGIVVGISGAFVVVGRLEGLLFETEARDPTVLLLVAAIMAGVAFLATSVPAWKATRVNPAVSMRAE